MRYNPIANNYLESAKHKLDLIRRFFKNIDSSVNASDTEIIEKEAALLIQGEGHKIVKIPINYEYSQHILSNAFLSTLILELSIKALWELSRKKIFNHRDWKDGHDILKIYNDLSPNIQEFISSKYDAELKYFQTAFEEWLNSYKSQNISREHKDYLLSAQYYSIEDCLEVNRTIVCDGKYAFQIEDKINVITGCIFVSEGDSESFYTERQPSPFLDELINFIRKKIADLSPKKKSS